MTAGRQGHPGHLTRGIAVLGQLRPWLAYGMMLIAALLLQGEALRLHAIEHSLARMEHGEAASASSSEAGSRTGSRAATAHPRERDDALCPLCQDASLFGDYLLPAVPQPMLAAAGAAVAAAIVVAAIIAATPPIRQRARDPPLLSA